MPPKIRPKTTKTPMNSMRAPSRAPGEPRVGVRILVQNALRRERHESERRSRDRARHMQRILVCLDSSPRAAMVLDAAVDLATRTGAKLELLRTVRIPTDIHGGMVGLSPAELSERLAE